jgi:F-type H+-transporting ATPase subunit delta
VHNLLDILVDNSRVAAMPSIASVFHDELERAQGVVSAEMTTAAPLDDAMKQRARTAVEKLTGRRVHLSYRVEPELIGGAVTRVGSMVYDGSLRTHIARLRRRMASQGS